MNNIQQLLTFFQTNGIRHLKEGASTRQLIYTNFIWLASFLTYLIYTITLTFFIPVPFLPFLVLTLLFNLMAVTNFLLIRNNSTEAGKHGLVISIYLVIAVFDHLTRKETLTWLYLFAFLPTALNIFSFKKNRLVIVLYILFPLFYILFTKLSVYSYPAFPALPPGSVLILTTFNIVLSSIMLVLFSGYMVFNSLAKHQKLLVQSIGLQATLDNAGHAIWSIDEDFNLVAANSKYIQSIEHEFGVLGLRSGINIRQHPIWEKLSLPLKEQYYTVLGGQNILHEIELNGSYFEIKAVPIYDLKGRISGATFGSRDITDEKKKEKALLAAKKAAEDAGIAKAKFLSNMSHEIRTPLNGIIGISRIMQDEEFLPGQLSNLTTLQDLSEHTLQLINNILDFAKLEEGKTSLENKRFNLRRFIDKINSIFSGTAHLKGLNFIIATDGEADVYVKGDEVRLSQILINLLGNAFKFTENGSITLKVSISDNINSENYNVSFSVSDTGIGIKKEYIGKIFDSFSQADSHTTRRFGGTGLGLTIAKKILTLMKSTLTVDSDPGKGSTFWFDISLAKSSIAPVKNNLKILPGTDALYNVNILLAEDNKINQMVANRILQKWQSRVTIASNGKEAVDCVGLDNFDVILMDLDMPVMDGYESMAIIKNNFPEIPVIALTAAAFDDMNNFLYNKGFCEVVQKPFVPEDLYSKIVSAIKRA
ncbi:MAG: ATP-binding protein [Chitinophagaceae bacterium]